MSNQARKRTRIKGSSKVLAPKGRPTGSIKRSRHLSYRKKGLWHARTRRKQKNRVRRIEVKLGGQKL